MHEENIKKIQDKIKKAETKITILVKQLSDLREKLRIESGNTVVVCEQNYTSRDKACGKESLIKNLIFIQSYYDTKDGPYNSTTWEPSEGYFNCPHCGYLNRMYNRKHIQDLKKSFKSVKDVYGSSY